MTRAASGNNQSGMKADSFDGSLGGDSQLLLSAPDAAETTRVFASRWLVLASYSLFAFLQGWCWAIPGPISTTYTLIYAVDSNAVQLMLNWGPIAFLIFALPYAYWMDRPGGMRGSVLSSVVLVVLGAVLRLLATSSSQLSVVLLHVSYFSNAAAGPVSMAAVSKLAENWFPLSERATATALAAEANVLGTAAAFVLGPLFCTSSDPAVALRQLMAYNWLCLAVCLLNLVGVIAYFPSHPPLPPTKSAHESLGVEAKFTLATFGAAIARLVCNTNFMILVLAYGLSGGGVSAWGSTLSINLAALGFDQSAAGGVGEWGGRGGSGSYRTGFMGISFSLRLRIMRRRRYSTSV